MFIMYYSVQYITMHNQYILMYDILEYIYIYTYYMYIYIYINVDTHDLYVRIWGLATYLIGTWKIRLLNLLQRNQVGP